MLLVSLAGSVSAVTWTAQADTPKQKTAKATAPATDLKKIGGEIRQLRSTLDSARDRISVQGALPKWIANKANGTAVPNVFAAIRKTVSEERAKAAAAAPKK